MNWQLLKNVNPPINKILMFFCKDGKEIKFAERTDDGESIYIASTYYGNELGSDSYRMNFEKYKKYYGDSIYWTLLVKP